MKWRGSTTGILLICSAGVVCAVGTGLFAANSIFAPSDVISERSAAGPDISKGQYELLARGMEYDDVLKILGREVGSKSSCTIELKNRQQVETNLFIYENGDGSNCMLIFQDQVLRVKSQFGLK